MRILDADGETKKRLNFACGAGQRSVDAYFTASKVQLAPLPSFRLMALGSMVQLSFARLSKVDPAAPSGGTPASASVANISLAVEPFTVLTFLPKVTSQLRAVMSALPVRQ